VLSEALAAGASVEAVFVEPGRMSGADQRVIEAAADAGVTIHELDEGVAHRVGSSTAPQAVLAVIGMVDVGLEQLSADGLVIVCSQVADPGNMGTVLRSSEAAGAIGVVCAAGSVDLYNSKCVRASAGALFHIPVVVGDETVNVLEQLSGRGLRCVGTSATGGEPLWTADLSGPVAVLVGNEAHGLGDEVVSLLDGMISIPISGRSESLNVGVAASVMAFEAARQRQLARDSKLGRDG